MNFVKSMFQGVKGKLMIVMIIPLLATIAITAISVTTFNSLGDRLDHAYDIQLPNTQRLGVMNSSRAQLGYFVWGAIGASDNAEEKKSFIAKAEKALANYEAAQKAYEAVPFEEEEEKNYKTIEAEKADFYSETKRMIEALKNNQDSVAKHEATEGNWHNYLTHIREGIEANLAYFEKQTLESDKEQTLERQQAMMKLMGVGGFSMLLIILLVLAISRSLTRSISEVSGVLSNSMDQVSGAIQQLSAAGSTLSSSTSTSAASLQETVASIEELSATVKHNSSNAKQAADLSQTSKESAQNGETEIRHLIESMKDISQSSRKIEEIINVIDDIAFQTNLLALNAAVEAARAGDQGRGFAVVAEAVRALAQRSAVAAKDISTLIKESVSKIESGVKTADKSGEVLSNIVQSVNQVSDLNREISVASQEQTNGITQISLAMNNLDKSVQTNAASAEEIASTSTEIASQSEQMQSVMDKLNAVIFGGATNNQTSSYQNVVPMNRKKEEVRRQAEAMIPFGEAEHKDRKIAKIENF